MNTDDLTIAAATPRTVKIGGEEFRLHFLTHADIASLQAWINSQFRDPFEIASEQIAEHSGRWTVAQQQYLLAQAMKEAVIGPPKIGTPKASELLVSQEGQIEIFYLSVVKGDPSFTRERARDVVIDFNSAEQSAVFAASGADMVADDPK